MSSNIFLACLRLFVPHFFLVTHRHANQFTGSLPYSLKHLQHLAVLTVHENSLDGKISEKLQLTGPCTLAGGFFPTGRLENRSISWSFMVRPRTMHSLLGKPNIPCQDLESTLGAEKTDQANREPRHRQSKLQDSGCSLHGFSNFLHPLQGESSGKRCKVVPFFRSCLQILSCFRNFSCSCLSLLAVVSQDEN